MSISQKSLELGWSVFVCLFLNFVPCTTASLFNATVSCSLRWEEEEEEKSPDTKSPRVVAVTVTLLIDMCSLKTSQALVRLCNTGVYTPDTRRVVVQSTSVSSRAAAKNRKLYAISLFKSSWSWTGVDGKRRRTRREKETKISNFVNETSRLCCCWSTTVYTQWQSSPSSSSSFKFVCSFKYQVLKYQFCKVQV